MTQVKDGLNAEQVAAQQRAEAAKRERDQWVQLARVYRRCVKIAETVWDAPLKEASAEQQTLAETMRDRGARGVIGGIEYTGSPRKIPVPLFTPRDRLEFIGREVTKLLISADRRNLTVQFPKELVTDAPEKPEAPQASAVEASSGVDETPLDDEARQLAEAGPQG